MTIERRDVTEWSFALGEVRVISGSLHIHLTLPDNAVAMTPDVARELRDTLSSAIEERENEP